MNKDLQERVLIAVNNFIPLPINDYVEDCKDPNTDILNLVLTLKHWANPKGGFREALSEQHLQDYFQNILQILKDPKELLSQEKDFTPDDEAEIAKLIRIKLDKIADELIKEYKLNKKLTDEVNNKEAIDLWWKEKSSEEKKQIEKEYQELSAERQREIQNRQSSRGISVYHNHIDIYPYYFMCNHHCHHHFLLLEGTVRGAIALGRLMEPGLKLGVEGVKAGVEMLGHSVGVGGGGGGGGCSGGGNLEGAAIVAFAAMGTSGVIGGAYATKKTYNSLRNLVQGKKPIRSLFRLSGIFGGGTGGAFLGASIGAALGSAVPGIGTAVGAVLGAIFLGGLGAGIGALITKYVAKGISAMLYPNELNPTNPDKYKLNSKQIEHIKKERKLRISVINKMIAALKVEKDKIGIGGSFPGTDQRAEKNKWNALLEKLKNGKIDLPYEIGGVVYDPRLSSKKQSKDPFINSHAQMSKIGIVGTGPSEEKQLEQPPAFNPEHQEIEGSVKENPLPPAYNPEIEQLRPQYDGEPTDLPRSTSFMTL